ncbi:MAG TPA: efflux RND transporter periplasmic adaptor subunit [Candidatus Didemnitutus sp.]|nr:efflux RND transporter periplasmic adaptor subunit [Candidatus Didemnitutus sp.]
MSTVSRRWIPYAGVAALIGLIALGLRPRPAPVETGRVSFGPLRATVSEEGKTRIRQRYIVSAPVSGLLRRIPFKPGADIADPNTIVAVIDPLPSSPLDNRYRGQVEARRDAARDLLEKSRKAHDLAVSEVHRVEKMYAAGSLAPQDLETAQMKETAAARDLAAAEGNLRQAEAELVGLPASGASTSSTPVEIRATATGQVLQVYQESTRTVAQGTPLLEIGDPTDLEVVVEMLSRDGAAIHPGAVAELDQWGGAKPLAARVRLVEPAAFTKISALGVEEQRVNVVADIVTPLAERRSLGDNFRVEARVVVWSADRVLQAPASGLFRHGEDWSALVVRSGRAHLVPVKVGHTNGVATEILAGLSEGDELVLYPGDRVHDGDRVQPLTI